MEMSNLKEGGTSARIVPGPNGIHFDGEDQLKFMRGEVSRTHDVFSGNFTFPTGDISFSSYLAGSNAGQGLNRPLKGSASTEAGDGDTHSPAFGKSLQKQIYCGKRATNESEISIFQAERYFSFEEEKKTDANHDSTTSKPRDNSNSKSKAKPTPTTTPTTHSSKDKVMLYDYRSSLASSIATVNKTFTTGASTPTASSEASWNSQSGMLATAAGNSVHNHRKRQSTRWSFCWTCPCSSEKSVDTDDTLTENRRASSVSNSMTSTALTDSPLSFINYSYAGLGKRVLRRSIEKQRTQAFVYNASEISDSSSCINGGSGIKSLINPVGTAVDYNIPQSGLSRDKELQQKMQRNCAAFMMFDRDSDQGELEEGSHQTKINCSSLVKDVFSFPILPEKCEETPRPSLEVLHSPFPGTLDREETRNLTSAMGKPHQTQPLDLHRRLVLCSLDKARKSFDFNSNYETFKCTLPESNADVVEDKESDSSSDLFEIESLATQGTASYAFRVDDSSSIQSGYPSTCDLGFHSSFHFGGMEEALTPSAQSFCYDPSEASLDWSVTTGGTMDKASLGKFSSDYEESKKSAALQGLHLSGLRESSMKGSSYRWSCTGSFLGCASEESVSVADATDHSQSKGSLMFKHKFANSDLTMSGKRPVSEPPH